MNETHRSVLLLMAKITQEEAELARTSQNETDKTRHTTCAIAHLNATAALVKLFQELEKAGIK